MRETARRGVAALCAVLVLGGCGTLNVEDEKELGRQAQRWVRQNETIFRDPVTVRYVRDIAEELAVAAPPSPFEFRFYVLEEDTLNAKALPGGTIYVYTGLIEAVDNVSELAGVIAHEISHVTARHVAEQYRERRNVSVAQQFVGIIIAIMTGTQLGAQAGSVVTGVASGAYMARLGKEAEREADALAIDIMARAGYDPNGLWTMFETLRAEYGEGGFQFLSDHPAPTERIDSAKTAIEERNLPATLKIDDGGRLQIIQKRIEMLIGTDIEDFLDDDEVDDYEDDDEY